METFRKLEADELRRRSVIPARGVAASAPRKGKLGALHHWRRGLVGAVQSWANGSIENVVLLVRKLIDHFNIAKEMKEQLEPASGAPCRDACASSPLPADDCLPWLVGGTGGIGDTGIVESLLSDVHLVKACNTEEQRREYSILLRAAAPPLS